MDRRKLIFFAGANPATDAGGLAAALPSELRDGFLTRGRLATATRSRHSL